MSERPGRRSLSAGALLSGLAASAEREDHERQRRHGEKSILQSKLHVGSLRGGRMVRAAEPALLGLWIGDPRILLRRPRRYGPRAGPRLVMPDYPAARAA